MRQAAAPSGVSSWPHHGTNSHLFRLVPGSRQTSTLLVPALTWYVYCRVTSQCVVETVDVVLSLEFMYVQPPP